MSINTLGYEVIADGEVPRTYTAVARDDLEAGDAIIGSGATAVVGSGASSYATSDIIVTTLVDSSGCNGVVTIGATSGNIVTVATRGTVLARAIGAVTAGREVIAVSGAIQGFANYLGSGIPNGVPAGRAKTLAASGTDNYFVLDLNL